MDARASGLDVLVLDRARFPRDKPCAEYLSPEASRIFAEMGVLDLIQAAGAAELSGVIVRSPSGVSFRGDYASDRGYRGFRDRGFALRRPILDTILLRQAESMGARVIEGMQVTDLVRDGSGRVIGVNARPSDDGACGLRPTTTLRGRIAAVRLAAFRRSSPPGPGPRETVAPSDRVRNALPRCRGYWFGSENARGAGRLHRARRRRARRDQRGGSRAGAVGAWGRRGSSGVHDGLDRKTSAHRASLPARHAHVTGACNQDRLPRTPAPGWAQGAALVGDAVDFFDPSTGEGIYAALRGAGLLTPYLHEALRSTTSRGSDIALAAYDRCRRTEFGGSGSSSGLWARSSHPRCFMNHVARVLAARRDMADLLIGVTGDFVPPREVLRAGYLLRLLAPAQRSPAPLAPRMPIETP